MTSANRLLVNLPVLDGPLYAEEALLQHDAALSAC